MRQSACLVFNPIMLDNYAVGRASDFSVSYDDGDPWAPNNLLKTGAKEKHQLNPGEPSNRQEAPVPTN